MSREEFGRAPLAVPMRYVRLPAFETLSGYSIRAVQTKIQDGVWLEGREYRKAPDGHILIDLRGYEKWVEGLAQAA